MTRDGPNAACALCSLSDGVDAAHVLRWKTASDECRAAGLCTTWQPQNGILLCRRCHTFFDALLLSVDPDGRVNVADALLQYDRADPRYAALNGSTLTLCTHRPTTNHLKRCTRRTTRDSSLLVPSAATCAHPFRTRALCAGSGTIARRHAECMRPRALLEPSPRPTLSRRTRSEGYASEAAGCVSAYVRRLRK